MSGFAGRSRSLEQIRRPLRRSWLRSRWRQTPSQTGPNAARSGGGGFWLRLCFGEVPEQRFSDRRPVQTHFDPHRCSVQSGANVCSRNPVSSVVELNGVVVGHLPGLRVAQQPVVCLDEKPVTLHADVRPASAAAPGREAGQYSEYKRCGTANVFCAVESKAARRRFDYKANPYQAVRELAITEDVDRESNHSDVEDESAQSMKSDGSPVSS